MIYFDTAYILKCYIHERGSSEVRQLLLQHRTAACCAIGRLEFASSLKRAIREGRLDVRALDTVFAILRRDDEHGIWNWLPVTPSLLQIAAEAIGRLPANVFIRAVDALHIVCARENGFTNIHSNDRHVIAAATHFGIKAMDVIA
jgi:predicted nucleic acid-binding protein